MNTERGSTLLGVLGTLFILGQLALIVPARPMSLNEALPQPDNLNRPQEVPGSLQTLVQEPTDRDRVKGTFEIDGRTVEVTEGRFYDTYLLLKPHEERPRVPLQPVKVWEHIMMIDGATAMGLSLTPEETAEINPLQQNPTMADALRQRWEQQGITETQYMRYLAETRAIQRLKEWSVNSSRILSQDVYDVWKRENLMFRVAYVAFDAAPHEAELRKTKPDEATLQEFWTKNPQIKNKYLIPTTVTATIVSFDPSKIDEAEIARLSAGRKIDYQEAISYFQKYQARMVAQIPSSEQKSLHPPNKVPLEEIVTPFQVLRKQIEREIILGDRITGALDEAQKAGKAADMLSIAKDRDLEAQRFDTIDRRELHDKAPQFGFNLFNDLFSAAPGTYSPIKYEGSVQYFWRLDDKAVSRLPQFEEIVGKGLEEDWYREEALVRAQVDAKKFLDEINEKVSAETAVQEKALDKEAVDKFLKEIEEKGITEDHQKDLVRRRHMNVAEEEKRKIRASLSPAHFDAAIKKTGAKLKEVGPFSFIHQDVKRNSITDDTELEESFLTTNFQVKAMAQGQVSQILSDQIARKHYVAKLLAREEPPPENMGAVDYHRRKMMMERQRVHTINYQFQFHELRRRFNLIEK